MNCEHTNFITAKHVLSKKRGKLIPEEAAVLREQNKQARRSIDALCVSEKQLRQKLAIATEALESYAECGDGCTCGDGWDHIIAREALAKLNPDKPATD